MTQKNKQEILADLHKINGRVMKIYKEFASCREMTLNEILALNVFIENWKESLFVFRNEVF